MASRTYLYLKGNDSDTQTARKLAELLRILSYEGSERSAPGMLAHLLVHRDEYLVGPDELADIEKLFGKDTRITAINKGNVWTYLLDLVRGGVGGHRPERDPATQVSSVTMTKCAHTPISPLQECSLSG